MGGRCVIRTRKNDLELYLHWCGEPIYIHALLRYCKLQGFRCPEDDPYGWARMCQVMCNLMEFTPQSELYEPGRGSEGLSVGIDIAGGWDEDWLDHGVYVIQGWELIERVIRGVSTSPLEGKPSEEDVLYVVRLMDRHMPEGARLWPEEVE